MQRHERGPAKAEQAALLTGEKRELSRGERRGFTFQSGALSFSPSDENSATLFSHNRQRALFSGRGESEASSQSCSFKE